MPARQPMRDQPVHGRRQQVHGGGRIGMPGHADAEHEQIAEPECQPGQEADFCDVDRGQPVVRIDAEADRAAGEYGGADIVADGVAGKTRHRRDAIGHVVLADRAQRKEVIEGQRAERPDHAQRGERNLVRRDFGQRGQHQGRVDALQRRDQVHHSQHDDEKTRSDPEPFPADLFLEATPEARSAADALILPAGRQFVKDLSRMAGNGQAPTACEEP